MKICHISDNHGYLGDIIPECDLIVHTGDFLPNRSFGYQVIEETFQPAWIEQNASRLRAWAGGRKIFMVSGNHDFVNSAEHLQKAGIDAVCIDDSRYEHKGVVFHGFPWMNQFGDWNFMIDQFELTDRTRSIDLRDVDVLAMHAPIYGILDRNRHGDRCGSKPMRKYLQDSLHVPNYVLHGHIHESHGLQAWSRGIMVSNAATTLRVIEV